MRQVFPNAHPNLVLVELCYSPEGDPEVAYIPIVGWEVDTGEPALHARPVGVRPVLGPARVLDMNGETWCTAPPAGWPGAHGSKTAYLGNEPLAGFEPLKDR